MNVYDFDQTIYQGDSTLDFYGFCLRTCPGIIRCLPRQLWGFLGYVLGCCPKADFKNEFYCFLPLLPNLDALVAQFWQEASPKIAPWYLAQQQPEDVVISASPEFLLLPLCHQLKIRHLLASPVNPQTGLCQGLNCYGWEKVRRWQQQFGDQPVGAFYSDSLSDQPMADLAQQSFMVHHGQCLPWETYQPSLPSRLLSYFGNRDFLAFLLVGGLNAFNGIFFAFLLALWLPANPAFILGYLVSLTLSYLLNSHITFKESLGIRKYFRFCLSYLPNFLIQNLVVLFFYNHWGWPKLAAFTLAAILGIPLTFLLMKLYAFRKS